MYTLAISMFCLAFVIILFMSGARRCILHSCIINLMSHRYNINQVALRIWIECAVASFFIHSEYVCVLHWGICSTVSQCVQLFSPNITDICYLKSQFEFQIIDLFFFFLLFKWPHYYRQYNTRYPKNLPLKTNAIQCVLIYINQASTSGAGKMRACMNGKWQVNFSEAHHHRNPFTFHQFLFMTCSTRTFSSYP